MGSTHARHTTRKARRLLRYGGLCLALAASGCDDTELATISDCEHYKRTALAVSACDPVVLPPADKLGDIECVDDTFTADAGTPSLPSCIEYLESHLDPCRPLDFAEDQARACTGDVVGSWVPTEAPDACERYKRAATYFAACDVESFADFDPEAPCVDDEALASQSDFDSVADCADFLLDHVWPPCNPESSAAASACNPALVQNLGAQVSRRSSQRSTDGGT